MMSDRTKQELNSRKFKSISRRTIFGCEGDDLLTVLDVLTGMDTPFSLGLYLRLTSGVSPHHSTGGGLQHARITKAGIHCAIIDQPIKVNVHEYLDARIRLVGTKNFFDLRDDFLVESLLKKYGGAPQEVSGIDRTALAYSKWLAAEEQCARANQRIRQSYNLATDDDRLLQTCLHRMSVIIQSLIGDSPDCEDLVSELRFGPGVSDTCKGITSAWAKILGSNTVSATPSASHHIKAFFGQYGFQVLQQEACLSKGGTFAEKRIILTPGNVLSFVPKNARIDRPICTEPHGNMPFQLAIGSVLKRLCKRKFDLSNQHINRNLALEGSIHGGLATVDFSSASDTICELLVREVFPQKWLLLLESFRSGYTRVNQDGKPQWVKLEKWSSMGNGYTFEMESLVFFAAAQFACETVGCQTDKLSVFGDDLIIPTEAYSFASRVFTLLGFSINEEKSFATSLFRESCGGFFFDGKELQTLYFRGSRNVESIVAMVNRLSWVAHSRNCYYGRDVRLRNGWLRSVARLGKDFCRGPLVHSRVPTSNLEGADHRKFLEGTIDQSEYYLRDGRWYRAPVTLGCYVVGSWDEIRPEMLYGPKLVRDVIGTRRSKTGQVLVGYSYSCVAFGLTKIDVRYDVRYSSFLYHHRNGNSDEFDIYERQEYEFSTRDTILNCSTHKRWVANPDNYDLGPWL